MPGGWDAGPSADAAHAAAAAAAAARCARCRGARAAPAHLPAGLSGRRLRCLQVCFLTNPVWVVKTRLQLQRRTVQQAAASAASAAASASGAALGGSAAAAAGPAAATLAGAAATPPAAAAAAAAAAARGGLRLPIPRLLGGPAVSEACAVEYRGFLHAFVQIARCEGLPGLYKGLLPSLLLVR